MDKGLLTHDDWCSCPICRYAGSFWGLNDLRPRIYKRSIVYPLFYYVCDNYGELEESIVITGGVYLPLGEFMKLPVHESVVDYVI